MHQAREGTTRDHDTQRFPYVLNTAGLKKPDEANDDGAERQTEHGANGDPDEAIAQAVTLPDFTVITTAAAAVA